MGELRVSAAGLDRLASRFTEQSLVVEEYLPVMVGNGFRATAAAVRRVDHDAADANQTIAERLAATSHLVAAASVAYEVHDEISAAALGRES